MMGQAERSMKMDNAQHRMLEKLHKLGEHMLSTLVTIQVDVAKAVVMLQSKVTP